MVKTAVGNLQYQISFIIQPTKILQNANVHY